MHFSCSGMLGKGCCARIEISMFVCRCLLKVEVGEAEQELKYPSLSGLALSSCKHRRFTSQVQVSYFAFTLLLLFSHCSYILSVIMILKAGNSRMS